MGLDRVRDDPRSRDRDTGDEADGDRVTNAPADSGHSDADTQTQRNIEDEPPG